MKKHLLVLITALLLTACATRSTINIDGMPISNHEYHFTNPETGLKVAYILVRYHKVYEGHEYMIVPEYLDARKEQFVQSEETERLVLHVKVVNLNKTHYTVINRIESPETISTQALYSGSLSRKDFAVRLPLTGFARKDMRCQLSIHLREHNLVLDVGPIQYYVKKRKEVQGNSSSR